MRGDHVPSRETPSVQEAKLVSAARSRLADSERSVARQQVLAEGVRRRGERMVEVEASLLRLEAAVVDCRAKLDALLARPATAVPSLNEPG